MNILSFLTNLPISEKLTKGVKRGDLNYKVMFYSRNDSSPKSEVVHEIKLNLKMSYLTHVWLSQLDKHQSCVFNLNPLYVNLVQKCLKNVQKRTNSIKTVLTYR